LGISRGATGAASVTLHPSADTFISETYPSNNFGALLFFNSGTTQNHYHNRGLVQFDIAGAIPPGSRILSASLLVECVGSPPPDENPPPARFNLHRALQPWGEGSKSSPTNCTSCAGQGGLATTNDATWNSRFAFTTNLWAVPGGAGGTDYIATASSGVTIYTENESPYTMASTTPLVADVQLWLDKPATNYGWAVVCQQEGTIFTARRIASREDTNNAPRLHIEYLIAPTIEKIRRGAGQFTLWFTAEAGQSYEVQYRTNLTTAPWQGLATFGPPAVTTPVAVIDAVATPQRFYRLLSY
jgi:hypothetical protein